MGKNFYHYPVWVRLWHLGNAVLCLFLIVTGFIMYLYDPVTDVADRYQRAVSIHRVCGVLLTISYIGFFFGNLFTDNGKHYRTTLQGLGKRLWQQTRYYVLGSLRGEEAPFPVDSNRKFNPLQQVTYTGLMYLVLPLLFITGWILLFPSFILTLFPGFNGLAFSDTFHIILGGLVIIFLAVHLVLSFTGKPPLHNLRSIITGWKEST
jgi:thiosulfate reductase cytochrome b subunit